MLSLIYFQAQTADNNIILHIMLVIFDDNCISNILITLSLHFTALINLALSRLQIHTSKIQLYFQQ